MNSDTNTHFLGKKIRKVTIISFLGGLGGGLSGACLYYGLLSLGAQSLTTLILIEGLCFVPIGACMGLSISLCNASVQSHMSKIVIAGSVAGFIYGGLAVFSIFGSLLGI